jgi:hypothetical protein
MSEHTPLPWEAQRLLPDGKIITSEAWEIRTPEYDVATYIPMSAPIRKEADARLIVRSVNEAPAQAERIAELEAVRDELVKVLEAQRDLLRRESMYLEHSGYLPYDEELDAIDAALAKAR